jgi:hypothetical protein
MSSPKKRCGGTRLGILLIVLGLLWFGQRIGWVPSVILGPLVLVIIGAWVAFSSSIGKREVSPCKGIDHELEMHKPTDPSCSR